MLLATLDDPPFLLVLLPPQPAYLEVIQGTKINPASLQDNK
jgi:hypothetical protein